MNNIVKFIYCLGVSGNDKLSYKITRYALYTTLIDKRTLSSSFKGGFKVGEDTATQKLLDYLTNKDELQAKAKKRWEAIRDALGAGVEEDTWE